ncbi:DUF2796 domain-containing protein [Thalassotalea profundi]|uniref:DUF2796 domain-containing protein n=1 Tax=Thalassotalea profundi TaxID=2036687 RepID=UPI001672487D|nr:DUF2796 domain-containing protein [Thalassotalea profundi]
MTSLFLHNRSLSKANSEFSSHTHGISELTIAIENQWLEIEIISPAINIVGFEHKAITETELAAVKNSASLLSKHEHIFIFTGGNCVINNQTINMSSIAPNMPSGDSKHLHSHKNNNEYKTHHHQNTDHGEVIANYRYHCKKSSTLSAITVKVFDLFVGISQINTVWITENQQGSVILNPTNKVINLR